MKARVPYLAGLADKHATRPTLQPPRPLFIGDSSTAVGSAPRERSVRRHPAAGRGLAPPADFSDANEEGAATTWPAGSRQDTSEDRVSGSTRGESPERPPTTQAPRIPAVPGGELPGSAPTSGPVPAVEHTPARPRPEPSTSAPDPGPPSTAADGVATAPPSPSSGAIRHDGDAVSGRVPVSWSDPLWGAPVALPPTIGPAPAAGDTGGRSDAHGPRASIAPLSPPEPVDPSAAVRNGGREIPIAPDDARAKRAEPSALAPVRVPTSGEQPAAAPRDLRPPAPTAPPSIEHRAPNPEYGGRERRPARSSRVSIGTIEVTVVPTPTSATEQIAAPSIPRSRPRTPSSLHASASTGADRLREGRRRWYGTAQG